METFPYEIFRCPVTGEGLRPVTAPELTAFNQAHAQSAPPTLGDGTTVTFPWEAAWRTTADPATWYPVIDGMPVLVPDSAVRA